MEGFDWLGLMKAITECHVESLGIAKPAPASEDAMAGNSGEGHPKQPLAASSSATN